MQVTQGSRTAQGPSDMMPILQRLGDALTATRLAVAGVGRIGADLLALVPGDAAAVWRFEAQHLAMLAQAGHPHVTARLADLLSAEAVTDLVVGREGHVEGREPGAVLPLVAEGRTVGAIGVRRRPGGSPYSASDTAYLRTVAHLLATAMHAAALRRALGTSNTRLRYLLQRSADVAIIVDATSRVLFVGSSISRLLGWTESELLGTSALDIVHPDDVAMARERLAAALDRPGAHEPFDLRVRSADGAWHWVEDRITNLQDDPDVGGLVVNFHDIGDRKAAQEELRRSEARYRSIVETAQEGIWLIDVDARTVFANQKLADILGRPLVQLYRMSATDVMPDDERPVMVRRLQRRLQVGSEVYETPFVRGDGQRRVALVSASPLLDEGGAFIGSLGMVTDITDRKRAEEQLERQALYDELTGLPNRALLADRLRQALGRRDTVEPLAVLFLDLDNFKAVNDSYGHSAGDRLLAHVAERLRTVTRAADTVARLAGDEFVVVCPGLGHGAAQALADRALDALAAPFDLGGIEVEITASAGIAYATAGQDPGELVGAGDAAMLEAKRRGRGGHVTFDSAIAARSRAHLQQVQDLRRGITAAEIVLEYQPQVDLATGGLVAAEALVRWAHPTRGLVGPADFIPLAEQTGLILSLGRTVLVTACAQAAEWAQRSTTAPRVTVNLSARQLGDDRLLDTLREALRRTALPPSRLRLELTETTVMHDVDRAVEIMSELRSLGVGLSIDDFGTGYSSLAYLTRLPLDELKIDGSFVAGVTGDGEEVEVVRAVIAMAHALRLRVVAEGVETPGQAQVLRRLGCDVGQGYLFARPGPAEHVLDMLARDGSDGARSTSTS